MNVTITEGDKKLLRRTKRTLGCSSASLEYADRYY